MNLKVNIKEIAQKIRQLLLEHNQPKDIALGVAVGVFIGCSPWYGFHTLLAVLVAFVMKKPNRLAIIAGTQISLPFLAPVIYWAEYKIGKFLIFCDLLIPQSGQEKLGEASNIELGLLSVLVGSVVLGLAFALLAYFATLIAAVRIKSKKGSRFGG